MARKKEKERVSLLEEGKDLAACTVCMFVLERPTSGCPEGHVFCGDCYATWLGHTNTCPTCRQPTDSSRSAPSRPMMPFLCSLLACICLRQQHPLLPDKAGSSIAGCSGTARWRASSSNCRRAARTCRRLAGRWRKVAAGGGGCASGRGTSSAASTRPCRA